MDKTLKEFLEEGVVTFTFTKSNGETRQAKGTRRLNLSFLDQYGFTEDNLPKGVKQDNPNVVPYWDLDKQAWRSVRINSIISIDEVLGEKELFGELLFE